MSDYEYDSYLDSDSDSEFRCHSSKPCRKRHCRSPSPCRKSYRRRKIEITIRDSSSSDSE